MGYIVAIMDNARIQIIHSQRKLENYIMPFIFNTIGRWL